MEWLEAGGADFPPVGTSAGGSIVHWGARADERFSAASRTAPLRDDGDPRGRAKQMLDDIMRDSPLPAVHGRQGTGYGEPSTTALPIRAHRLALPKQAVVLKIRPWLSPATAAGWERDVSPADDPPKGYFAASEGEWRAVAMRLVRCGLGRLLGPNTSPPGLAAGAFAVPKDADQDRLIADRRPRNAGEQQPGPVRLPYAPRLRRLLLQQHEAVWVEKRDLSNCFYLFEV